MEDAQQIEENLPPAFAVEDGTNFRNYQHLLHYPRYFWYTTPRRHGQYDQNHRNRAIAMHQEGLSYREIATRIGTLCSSGTVYKWIRRAEQNENLG